MPNAGLAVKISPPILALWVALHSMAVSGCSAPDLTFADEMVDGKTPAVLPDAVVALSDAPTGGPRYLGGDGTVTASNAGTGIEDMTHAWDNDTNTKWFCAIALPWTAYQFAAGVTHVLTSYTVTSGNDFPARDPRSWRLEGSNDGAAWTTLDTQADLVFTGRIQKAMYSVASSTAYGSYRFNVTANNGSTNFQVAEIELFGY